MKIRTLLSIMLIGMISLTAFATTSKLEQKQKPTITLDQTVCIDVVNVGTIDFVVNEINSNMQSEAYAYFILKNEREPGTHLAIITDVGWKVSKQNFTDKYKRNLLETNRIQLVSLNNKTKARIRNDC
ncbi:MAG: hypothetical protein H7Z76_16130 [Methylotenera sp.]|nr:hypothetical protein [Flavobacterium sp.]